MEIMQFFLKTKFKMADSKKNLNFQNHSKIVKKYKNYIFSLF